jgi:glycosyltransferase involved in cell wall biosynthesis/SAM-dependent methyltransferase
MYSIYNNSFGPNNVYGHSLDLLGKLVQPGTNQVHLDVGCGFGAIAPHIAAMGLEYVGVDISVESVEHLTSQGFEAHLADINQDCASLISLLLSISSGRVIASITILDTLEHVAAPIEVMRAVRAIAVNNSSPIVVSVPNVTHTEIASRIVTGHFEYTADGLLDHTHVIHFSSQTLKSMSAQAGLFEVAASDTTVSYPLRDMHLDLDAPSHHSAYYQLIAHVRQHSDKFSDVYQLVRAFLPGPPLNTSAWYKTFDDQQLRPFLSIVIRTIGTELYALRDTLLCLSGQTDMDFEVVLIGHNLKIEHQISIEQILLNQPRYLQKKIKFLQTNQGGRAHPLNIGYKVAAGHYITTLDDDDIVFGNYVEEFRSLYEKMPGRLLRVRCASQSVRKSNVEPAPQASISIGPIQSNYPADFNFLDHLSDNFTPCMSVAYPREIIHTFGLEFDESLSTAEDWDFMLRSYFLLGIAVSPVITCIYRRWTDKTTSAILHSKDEWEKNRMLIIRKHDSLPVILAQGELRNIRKLYNSASTDPIKHTEALDNNLPSLIANEVVTQLNKKVISAITRKVKFWKR